MRYRKPFGVAVTLGVVIFVLLPVWLTWKQFRQDSLNASLVHAVLSRNRDRAIALLDQGANPNLSATPPPQRTFWQILLDLIHRSKSASGGGTAPSLLLWQIAQGAMPEGKPRSWKPHEYPEIVRSMLDHGANPNVHGLVFGLTRGDMISAYGSEMETPLLVAIHQRQFNVAKMLVEHGADVNDIEFGQTPLMAAACGNVHETARFLLDHGANPNANISGGETALMMAALSDETETATLLLDRGADLNAKDERGDTPLTFARYSDGRMVNFLLDHGAKPDPQMLWSFIEGKFPAMKVLLNRTGYDVRAEERRAGEPLLYLGQDIGILKLLLSRGADPNFKGKDGFPPLVRVFSQTISGEISEGIPILVKAGADVNATDKGGMTPLMYTAQQAYPETVEAILSEHPRINARDTSGKTALRFARVRLWHEPRPGIQRLVQLLINAGARE